MHAKPLQIVTLLLLSLVFTLTSLPLKAEPIDSLAEAINQAGRQRMLTQRIVKAYSQNLLDVDAPKAKGQMVDALVLFERQLDNLRSFAPTPEVESAIDEVEQLWSPFRDQASSGFSDEGLNQLNTLNEPLLVAAHRVVLRLEALSTTPVGRLVNIAGRQRMLSQRIAKFYMLRAYGVQDETTHAELMKAADEFRTALEELIHAPENSEEINTGLAEVKRQWTVFEVSFRLKEGEYAPLMIALFSEKLLQKMNTITGLYAKLSAG